MPRAENIGEIEGNQRFGTSQTANALQGRPYCLSIRYVEYAIYNITFHIVSAQVDIKSHIEN